LAKFTIIEEFNEVILVFATYKPDSLKEKLERHKLLYNTRLKVMQTPNKFH